MKRTTPIFASLLTVTVFLLSGCKTEEQPVKLSDKVNPFIGTGGHGHTFPGATVPFGMVQLSPDTRLTGWDGCSGYHFTDSVVYGFSHTHLSGTGVSDYADILFMPTTGEVLLNNGADGEPGYSSLFSKKNESATAGFYKTYLDDYNIGVELTATERCGFHQYSFGESNEGNVILDLEHRDKVIDAQLRIVSETEVEGYRISDAWAKEQHVYFVAQFSQPFTNSGVAVDGNFSVGIREANHHALKACFEFGLKNEKQLLLKVGISAVSVEGARKNLEAEIPAWDFELAKSEARSAWEAQLSKIEIEGGTDDQQTIFYSALYHSMIAPNIFQDVDGRYRGTDLKIHQATNHRHHTIFSLWDTYRATHPLYTIIEQERTTDFINTFLAHYQQGGQLPIWELAGNYTGCMIGYHAIPVIADAHLKGIGGFNVDLAMEAMMASANQDHLGLEHYKKLGFIPSGKESESVSKTLEYAYDDWCIAKMAEAIPDWKDSSTSFYERAQFYKNLYDPETGFMRARNNGMWFSPFDPSEVNFNYTEANAWQYSLYVPQDVEGLMEIMGGKEVLSNHLDDIFNASSQTTGRDQADITGLIGQYAHGNEPSHHMAYLYHYVGQHWKTQQRVRQILDELYQNAPDGLSGNEDCGQMSSWYVLSSMGFYPVCPGDINYIIGTPLFPSATINLENGKQFVVNANNVSDQNIYIQSATLNSQPLNRSFIQHDEIMAGGILEFEMGTEPNKSWGNGENDIAGSSIEQNLITPVPFVANGDRVFTEETEFSLSTPNGKGTIHYTLDESEPTVNSAIFTAPIPISETTILKAFAIGENKVSSKTIQAKFNKIPPGRKIEVKTKYASQYSAGGDMAMIDYIRGTHSFMTGAWQGFEKVNMDVVIDLGKTETIQKITTGFLQDINSWIFMPYEMEVLTSIDGENFTSKSIVKNEVDHQEWGAIIRDFEMNFQPTKVRFVRVIGKNIGHCPPWHKGNGNKCWVFADEVMIE